MRLLKLGSKRECLANASRNMYADVFVLHAIADMKKGDEVTVHYIDPIIPYTVRKEHQAAYSFECDCRLCELDRKDPMCEKRSGLQQKCIAMNRSLSTKYRPKAMEEALRLVSTASDVMRLTAYALC